MKSKRDYLYLFLGFLILVISFSMIRGLIDELIKNYTISMFVNSIIISSLILYGLYKDGKFTKLQDGEQK